MEFGTVVVLDTMSHPTDFGFKRAKLGFTVEVRLGIGLGLEFRLGLKLGNRHRFASRDSAHIPSSCVCDAQQVWMKLKIICTTICSIPRIMR